jgi:uncharacterized protein
MLSIRRNRWLLACLLLFSTLLHAEVSFPALSGRVVDLAGILSSDEHKQLDSQLANHEQQTSNQVVVVTVPSLDGLSIEEYGNQLGRQWGIGTREHNNGVLLIVALQERKVRIEVGYGLEGALPDAIAANIIQTRILPRFRQGDLSAGITAGVSAILQAVRGEYHPQKPKSKQGNGDSLIFWLFLLGFIGLPLLHRFGPPGIRQALQGSSRHHGGWGGGWGGGSSGGGGFSGGGGGFGGGGASGGW